jgi:hypothetical protein
MIRSNLYLRHNSTRMRLKKMSELSQSSILKLLFLQLLLKGLNRASRGMLDGGCWPLNRTDLRNWPSYHPIRRFVLGTRSDWSRHTATCYMHVPGKAGSSLTSQPNRSPPSLAPPSPPTCATSLEQATPAGGGGGGDGGQRLQWHGYGVRLSSHLAPSLFPPSLV